MASNAAARIKGVEVLGGDRVPADGALIVPSALSYHELLFLEKLFAGRKVSFLVAADAKFDPLVQDFLERPDTQGFGFIPGQTPVEELKKELHSRLSAKELIVFIPSPVAARHGAPSEIPGPMLEFLMKLGAPTLPIFVCRPGEVRLAIESTSGPGAILSLGNVLARDRVTVSDFQEELLQAGEAAFCSRPALNQHLGYALLQGMKKHGRMKVIDGAQDGKEMGYDMLLASAIVLAKYIKEQTKKDRVGIVLPPGQAGTLANLAVLLAGKTPVNLNFTAGKAAVESAIRQADIDRFLTVDLFVRKQQTFPWPPLRDLIFIERTLPKMKPKILLWLLLTKALPAATIASMIGLPKKGGDSEAVLLFTSGSSGEPKGVVLTHRNVIANVNQFASRLSLDVEDKILACLPLFHSFGCTVTLWYPMIEGLSLVTYPLPMDAPKLADLVEQYRASLLLSTPTFLRGFLRRVKRDKLAPLKMIVVGAEKLPQKLREQFIERFGKDVMEGYGLTETSPVTNVNLPDPEPQPGLGLLPSHRPGSVGQPMPGLSVRITNPSTEEHIPLHESGIIWFRGPNIFGGYLGQPKKTAEVMEDGWFRTGDVGRMDSDGFLYIEGRISRFSKIGGEMVPHERVEEYVNRALGLDGEAERKIAIVGIPDEDKGEALALLSTVAGETISQEIIDLRYTLLDMGVPALWIPKKLVRAEDIPLLASGKLDIKRCEELVKQGLGIA